MACRARNDKLNHILFISPTELSQDEVTLSRVAFEKRKEKSNSC